MAHSALAREKDSEIFTPSETHDVGSLRKEDSGSDGGYSTDSADEYDSEDEGFGFEDEDAFTVHQVRNHVPSTSSVLLYSLTPLTKPKAPEEGRRLLIALARVFLLYGAPSYKLEGQLRKVAKTIQVKGDFIYNPGEIICNLHDDLTKCRHTEFVQADGGIELGKLPLIHAILKQVMHDQISAKEGAVLLEELSESPPEYSRVFRVVLAFAGSFIICLMSFGGSIVDAGVPGILSAFLAYLQLFVAGKHPQMANIIG
jgi:hypothetical protein